MAVRNLFVELTRLKARYAVALTDPLSCPRNREILRTKIGGLLRVLRDEAAKDLQISDKAEVQRMERDIMMPRTPTPTRVGTVQERNV